MGCEEGEVERIAIILNEGGRFHLLGQEQFLEGVPRYGLPKEGAKKVPRTGGVKLAVQIVIKVMPMLNGKVVSIFFAFVVESLHSGLEGAVEPQRWRSGGLHFCLYRTPSHDHSLLAHPHRHAAKACGRSFSCSRIHTEVYAA